MTNDGTKDLRDFYEIVDWFRSAEASGGKVELLIAPKRGNAEERVITVGFHGGTSRDQISFSITDGDYFDSVVLPKILDYYSKGDKYIENYELSNAKLIGQTSKLTLETEGGNLVYLETYNPELLEETVQNLEEKEEPQTVLTEYQKEWREIINCVKSRREVAQKYSSIGLSLEEVSKLSQVSSFLSALPEFTPGYSEMSKQKIEKNLRMLLSQREYNEELRKIGIGEDQYQQIMSLMGQDFFQKRILRNDDTIMAWVKNIQAEKRINKSIERNSMTPDGYSKKKYDQYVARLEFATRELGKRTVNFYHLTNAPYEEFELHEDDQNYGKNCAGAVATLKKSYEEGSQYISEEKLEQYRTYCDEVLEYLQQKAKIAYERKKGTMKDTTDIVLEPYSQIEHDTSSELEEGPKEYNDEESFENLMHSIELCKNARVGKENFEIIIEQDSKNPTKRYVRVALTNGVSRQDSFYFEFEDGSEFDTKIGEVLSATLQEDKILNFTKIPVLEAEDEKENALLTTKNGNEILLKVSRKLNEEVEEFLREKVNDTKENLAQETREEKETIQTSPTEVTTIINIPDEEMSTQETSENLIEKTIKIEDSKSNKGEIIPIEGTIKQEAKQNAQENVLKIGRTLAAILEDLENMSYEDEMTRRDLLINRDRYETQLTYMFNPEYKTFSPKFQRDNDHVGQNDDLVEELTPEDQNLMKILVELTTAQAQLDNLYGSDKEQSPYVSEYQRTKAHMEIRKAEIALIKWKNKAFTLEDENSKEPKQEIVPPPVYELPKPEPKEILRLGWILASAMEKIETHTYVEQDDSKVPMEERIRQKGDLSGQELSDLIWEYRRRLTCWLHPKSYSLFPAKFILREDIWNADEAFSQQNSPTEEELNPNTQENQKLMQILLEMARANVRCAEVDTIHDDRISTTYKHYKAATELCKAEMELVKWKLEQLSLKSKNSNAPEQKVEKPLTESSETNENPKTKTGLTMQEKCLLVVEQLKKIAKSKAEPKKEITPKLEAPQKVEVEPKKEATPKLEAPQKVEIAPKKEKTPEAKSVVQQLKELKLTVVNSIEEKIKVIVEQIREWKMVKSKEDMIKVELSLDPGEVVGLTLSSTLPASETLTEKFTREELSQQLIPELADVFTETNSVRSMSGWSGDEREDGTIWNNRRVEGDDTMITIKGPDDDSFRTYNELQEAIRDSEIKRKETPENGESLGKKRK